MAALPSDETFQLREVQSTAMWMFQDSRRRRPFEQKKHPQHGGKVRQPPKSLNVTECEDDGGYEDHETNENGVEELVRAGGPGHRARRRQRG
eukprot:4759430-Pyramimonas_sp.AAC.1